MLSIIKKLLPGILLVCFVTLCATTLAPWCPGPGSATLAVLLGMLLRLLLPDEGEWVHGVKWVEKKVLGVAVALLGFGLDVGFLVKMGSGAFVILVLSVIGTLFTGVLIARLANVSWQCGWLIAIGNAFCGASAIVASAGILKCDRKDIAISVGVVSFLGTLGIFILPPYIHYLDVNVRDSALLIGGGMQAIGHVAAVGHGFGEDVAELAMAFKMLRIVLLIPFLMIIGSMGGDSKGVVKPPNYVIGFAIAVLIRWSGGMSYELFEAIGDVAHMLLVGVMAGLGLGIHLVSLIRQGAKTIAVGAAGFVCLLLMVQGLSHVF